MLWSAFLPAALLLVLTPGSGTLCVWRAFLRGGWRAAGLALAGLLLGDMLLILLSALGVAALLAANPLLFAVLRWGGAGYLIYLGCQCWRQAALPPAPDTTASRRQLYSACVLTLGNPKAIVFFMAFFPQFLPAGQAALPGFLQLGVVFCLLNLSYLLALLWLGSRFGAAGSVSRLAVWGQRASGLMLLGLGLRCLWQRQPA